MNWFSLFLLIWIGGYLLNRITFWIGAFLCNWCKLVWIEHQYWYNKNTLIKDIVNDIKYNNGLYEDANFYRFVPFVNLNGVVYGIIMISGFIGTIIGLILGWLLYIIWKYFLSYIWKLFKYLYNSHIFNYIENVYNNIINKILHIRIS